MTFFALLPVEEATADEETPLPPLVRPKRCCWAMLLLACDPPDDELCFERDMLECAGRRSVRPCARRAVRERSSPHCRGSFALPKPRFRFELKEKGTGTVVPFGCAGCAAAAAAAFAFACAFALARSLAEYEALLLVLRPASRFRSRSCRCCSASARRCMIAPRAEPCEIACDPAREPLDVVDGR